MILKATRLFSISLMFGLLFAAGFACAPATDFSNPDSEVDFSDLEVSGLLNSQSVGAGGAPHEKAVLGLQMLGADGKAAGECSAVLIRNDAILLAAHCFDPHVLPGVVNIIVHTSHDMNKAGASDPASRRIARYVLHPHYNSTLQMIGDVRNPRYDNDIAIAFLDQPVATARPQPMAETYQSLVPGMTLTAYGYGRAIDWTDSPRIAAAKKSKTRQRGTVTISKEMVDERYLTTKESKSNVCQGDSGGPTYLIEKGKAPLVMGINSASNGEIYVPGTNMRRCRGQSVILPIAPYRSWIDQTLMESRQ